MGIMGNRLVLLKAYFISAKPLARLLLTTWSNLERSLFTDFIQGEREGGNRCKGGIVREGESPELNRLSRKGRRTQLNLPTGWKQMK